MEKQQGVKCSHNGMRDSQSETAAATISATSSTGRISRSIQGDKAQSTTTGTNLSVGTNSCTDGTRTSVVAATAATCSTAEQGVSSTFMTTTMTSEASIPLNSASSTASNRVSISATSSDATATSSTGTTSSPQPVGSVGDSQVSTTRASTTGVDENTHTHHSNGGHIVSSTTLAEGAFALSGSAARTAARTAADATTNGMMSSSTLAVGYRRDVSTVPNSVSTTECNSSPDNNTGGTTNCGMAVSATTAAANVERPPRSSENTSRQEHSSNVQRVSSSSCLNLPQEPSTSTVSSTGSHTRGLWNGATHHQAEEARENHDAIPQEFLESALPKKVQGDLSNFPYHSATDLVLQPNDVRKWIPTCIYRRTHRQTRDCEFMFFLFPLAELLHSIRAQDVHQLYVTLQSRSADVFESLYGMIVRFEDEQSTIPQKSEFMSDREAKISHTCRKRIWYALDTCRSTKFGFSLPFGPGELRNLKQKADATPDRAFDERGSMLLEDRHCFDECNATYGAEQELREKRDSDFRYYLRALSGTFVPKAKKPRNAMAKGAPIDLKPKNGTMRAILAMFYQRMQSEFPLQFLGLLMSRFTDDADDIQASVECRMWDFHRRFLPTLLSICDRYGVGSLGWAALYEAFFRDDPEVLEERVAGLRLIAQSSTRSLANDSSTSEENNQLDTSEIESHKYRNVDSLVKKSFQMGWLKLQQKLAGPVDITHHSKLSFALPSQWRSQNSRIVLFSMTSSNEQESSARHYWSSCYAYYVNGSFLNVPKNCKAPIDISSLCKPNDNIVTCSSYKDIQEHVILGVYESIKVSSENVFKEVVNERVMSRSEAQECLKTGFGCSAKCPDMEFADLDSVKRVLNGGVPVGKKRKVTNDEEDEIQTDSFGLSACDPVSLSPIALPVRGRKCNHLRSFDLSSFLKLNAGSSPKWLCPVCNQYVFFVDIYVDIFFYSVLFQISRGNLSGTIECIDEGKENIEKKRSLGEDVSIDWGHSETKLENIRTINISPDGKWNVLEHPSNDRGDGRRWEPSSAASNSEKPLNSDLGDADHGHQRHSDVIEILSDDDD